MEITDRCIDLHEQKGRQKSSATVACALEKLGNPSDQPSVFAVITIRCKEASYPTHQRCVTRTFLPDARPTLQAQTAQESICRRSAVWYDVRAIDLAGASNHAHSSTHNPWQCAHQSRGLAVRDAKQELPPSAKAAGDNRSLMSYGS